MIDFQLKIIDRDSSVRINRSVYSEAKDIFWGLIRRLDSKFSEKRFSFF
jgi:hypothetical protein